MITSKEFTRWALYLQQEPNEFNTLHYYLAMIAMILVKVNSKNPNAVKLEDFLLDFTIGEKERKGLTPEQAEVNKNIVLSGLGISTDTGIAKERKFKTIPGSKRGKRKTIPRKKKP